MSPDLDIGFQKKMLVRSRGVPIGSIYQTFVNPGQHFIAFPPQIGRFVAPWLTKLVLVTTQFKFISRI